ncbi:ABC transporter permease [Sphaerimonospora thailandensis]|uniref:ABC transporter substrate-binding protein n=1 Tax=Sphaerimonospora thailandensis TaxID=795644 RepID=A0A8J3W0S0_9ACTN|nr:ABC transporter permease [Sphaerimonospora thailandensis]GIH72529.1 ABC transporter substrate-binding protein [Sphaerimonospora thailandensis]
MWRLALRNALAHRARLALTLIAVILGVTFVTGSLVLTDTSQRLLDDQFRTATAGVDLTVRDAAAFDSAMGVEVERDPLPPTVVDQIRTVPGVATASPVVRGSGLLSTDKTAGGKAIVPSGSSLLASWEPAPVGAFTLRAGRPPAADDEIVIDAATAEGHHIALGDTITVQAERTAGLRVVGLAGFGGAAGLPGSTVGLVNLPTAQRLLGLGDGVTEVAVIAAEDIDPQQLQNRVAAALGTEYAVAASRDIAAASADAAKTQVAYLQLMLLALAAAALLVGAFLIANTFSIVITQRTREIAVLRAAGATGGQVLRSVLGEAFLVGITASIAGVGLGVATAAWLRSLAGAFGITLPDGGLIVAPRTVIIAFLVGIGVTIVSAIGPARRAATVAPVEAMRLSSASAATGGRARTVIGWIMTGLGAAGLTAVIAGPRSSVGLIAPVGAAAISVIVGLVLLGPAVTPTLARLIGRPLDAAGVPGRLARESAARAPRRTAATALALAIGLALISFMTVLATSIKASVASSYKEVISADYVIESARNEMLGGLSHHVHHHVSELAEVAVASRLRYGHWKDGEATRALTAVDPATLPEVASPRMVAGGLNALSGGGIVLAESVARQRHLAVGDSLPMTFSLTGTQRIPVVGLMLDRDAHALSTDYLISLDTFSENYREHVDASVFVKIANGVSDVAAKKAINGVLADYPTAQLRDQAAAVAGRTLMIDQVLGMVTALLMLTILIAALGITNTLALSIMERTREIGLLRAVGMTGGQMRWMIRGEAVLIAALAIVLGVGMGIAFAAGTVAALGSAIEAPLVLPVGRLLIIVTVAALAGLLAGLLPARRAARLDVLTAIAAS